MVAFFWIWEENLDSDDTENVTINNDIIIDNWEEWQLALDILEDDNFLYIIAPIAWVELEDIDIEIEENVLTIKWYRNKPEELLYKHINIKTSECFWWRYKRNIILPDNLNLNSIKASLDNNLLIVTITKFDTKKVKIDRIDW